MRTLALFSLAALLLLSTFAVSKNAYADHVTFTKIIVESSPVPNKPFALSATVRSEDPNTNVQLSIRVPGDISVSGQPVVDLGILNYGTEKTASWTLTGASPGTFPVTITSYSSSSTTGTSRTSSIDIFVSIGAVKGLIVTDMKIPGNIFENDIFTVDLVLKNAAAFTAENIIARITVPQGLHVVDDASQSVSSLVSGDSKTFSWKLKATDVGSFNVNFDYSSTNAGTDAANASVNVGERSVSDVRPGKMFFGDSEEDPQSLRPGDRNIPLHVTLENAGSVTAYDVEATLLLEEPFKWDNSAEALQSSTFSIDRINTGESEDAVYYISVDASAKANLYAQKLQIIFSDGAQKFTKTYDIPLDISPNVVLSISGSGVQVQPGFISPVTFDVVNNGEEIIHDLAISTVEDGKYTSIDSPVFVGDITPGATKAVNMQIYTAPETFTVSPLILTLEYESNGKRFEQRQQMGVELAGNQNFGVRSIQVTPPTAYPGDTNIRIDVGVVNSGFVAANNLEATLVMQEGLAPAWGDSNKIYIGRLLPDEASTASFFVNIDRAMESRVYPLKLELHHDKGDTSLIVNFVVSQKAKFELIDVSDSGIYPGASNVPLKLTLKNDGQARAETITTRFLGGNILPGVKSNTITSVGDVENVGSVAPGQVFTTTFIVNVDPVSTPGDQTSTLEIKWVQNGNVFVESLTVPLQIAQGPNYLLYAGGIPWTYVIMIAFLAVAAYMFASIRKKRIAKMRVGLTDASLHYLEDKEFPKDDKEKRLT